MSLRDLRPVLHGFLFVALLGWSAACSESASTRPGDVPASHTQRRGGAWHAPGFRTPVENCGVCHGRDLRGGANGEPSCYSCHESKWS